MAFAEMKHISEVLPDALQEMRELWREFDLNNSQNAGMRITYDNGEVKQHGTITETSQLRAFPAIPSAGSSVLSGGSSAGYHGKRNTGRR